MLLRQGGADISLIARGAHLEAIQAKGLKLLIGGDPVHGIGFTECLELFFADPETEGVVLIGEIGGQEEEDAARWLAENGVKKPVVALVAGRHAPAQRRMGHAGALTVPGSGDADSKIAALQSAGVTIAQSAHQVGATMRQALEGARRQPVSGAAVGHR